MVFVVILINRIRRDRGCTGILRDFVVLVQRISGICRDNRIDVIVAYVVRMRIVYQRFRSTVNRRRIFRGIAIDQARNRAGILQTILDGINVAIRSRKVFRVNRQFCLCNTCRISKLFARCTALELVVLSQGIAELNCRAVVVTEIFRHAAGRCTCQCSRIRDDKFIRTIAVNAVEGRRAEGILCAIGRRVKRLAVDAKFIFLDRFLVDRNVAITLERVVGIHIGRAIYNMNIAELKLICVRTGIGRRAVAFARGIFAIRADSIFYAARIELVIAIKACISRAGFRINILVVQRGVAIRLRCTAVEVYRTTVDFKIAIDVFRRAVAIFTLQIAADRDVINGFIVIICRTHAARTGGCCRCTGTFNIDRARVVVHDVAFLEGLRIVMNVDVFAVLAFERCRFRNRQVAVREFNTIRFFLVFSRNRQIWLYLEDVLVAVVLTCRVRSARRAPLCIRVAVEVRAESITVRRSGINFPVAVCASRDGFRCRRVIMEGTVRAASVDDDSIVSCGRGNQSTIAIWIVV